MYSLSHSTLSHLYLYMAPLFLRMGSLSFGATRRLLMVLLPPKYTLLCPWDICSSCIYFYSTCNSLVILTFHFISMKTISALLLEAFAKYFTSIISSWVNLTFKNTLFFIQDNVHPVSFDIQWKSGYIWISWVFILLDCVEIVPDWLLMPNNKNNFFIRMMVGDLCAVLLQADYLTLDGILSSVFFLVCTMWKRKWLRFGIYILSSAGIIQLSLSMQL